MRGLYVFVLLCALQYSNAGKLPGSITPCKRNSGNFQSCLLTEGKKFLSLMVKGIPELGIPSLDPIKMKDADLKSTSHQLRLKTKNVKLTGLKTVELKDLKIDLDKRTIKFEIVSDLRCKLGYNAVGQVAIINLNNDGNIDVKGTQFDFKFNMTFNVVKGKDGLSHMRIKKSDYEFDVEKGEFKIDGFADKAMETTVNTMLNQSWKMAFKEFGRPAADIFNEKVVELLNKMFAKVPYDELFPK